VSNNRILLLENQNLRGVEAVIYSGKVAGLIELLLFPVERLEDFGSLRKNQFQRPSDVSVKIL
jgi:hypothetical protein